MIMQKIPSLNYPFLLNQKEDFYTEKKSNLDLLIKEIEIELFIQQLLEG